MPNNFAYGTVLTAPSPATSGTSMVLNSGQGALMPTVPFSGTIWPVGVQPTTANAEIVIVTAVVADTLTIVRAMEGSTARTVVVGDQFAATATAETVPTQSILITSTATDRNYVLRGSQSFSALDHFETGSSYTTEIPATSTLEIIPGDTQPLPVAFLARLTTDQSGVVTVTPTTVQAATEVFDISNNYDITTFTFTAPFDGVYHLEGTVEIDAPGVIANTYLYVNGLPVARVNNSDATAADDRGAMCSITIKLYANDAVTLRGGHNAGANRTFLGSVVGACYFSGFMVGQVK